MDYNFFSVSTSSWRYVLIWTLYLASLFYSFVMSLISDWQMMHPWQATTDNQRHTMISNWLDEFKRKKMNDDLPEWSIFLCVHLGFDCWFKAKEIYSFHIHFCLKTREKNEVMCQILYGHFRFWLYVLSLQIGISLSVSASQPMRHKFKGCHSILRWFKQSSVHHKCLKSCSLLESCIKWTEGSTLSQFFPQAAVLNE